MKRLTNRDIQQIDEEIMGKVGKGTHGEVVSRLRELAEIYRVYANRAGNLCQDVADEQPAQRLF